MTINQRFIKAFDYLKVEGFVKNQITFYEGIGIDKNRFRYLYNEGNQVENLKAEEIKALQANYPQINWNNYVNLGVGPMLSNDEGVAHEEAAGYDSHQWRKEQLNLIVTGISKLPAQEQLKLLRAAYVEATNENIELKGEIIRLQKAGQSSLLDEIKNVLKGK